RAQLAAVEHEISRLCEQMQSLEEECASLSGHLLTNTAVLSPLRRMPAEVLGEIFSWTLPSVNTLRLWGFGVGDSPWLLTHISSRWRTVGLSTPALWSLLVINFP
ncbi:hypothetical protein C8R44DRAFT_559888, partial [Mycena epipterygia]